MKAGAEFGPNIFCVDSYVGIKEIFKIDMGNSCVEPKDTEIIEEKEIVKNEMEAVKHVNLFKLRKRNNSTIDS